VPEVAEHEVAEPEVASMAAELPAKVDHGVLTGKDPAKRSLAGCRLEAAEAPDHAGISVRTDGQLPVVTVKGSENGSPLPV
jgi:hypothetical protein